MADDKTKAKHVADKRLVFAHKNLQRWALFSTVPNMMERVLERKGPDGQTVEKVIIGSVMVNGQPRTLSTEEGAMMNLIEGLHHRYRPTDGVLRVPTTAFYDYVVDIGSFNDPGRRKKRDGVDCRNYVYDRLYVLAAVPIMYSDWREKSGEGGVRRFNLLDGFKMFGKTKEAKWGMIEITINPVVAAGLRAKHTSPVLLEIANSMNTPASWALYRYLDKVLAKRTKFEIPIAEYVRRLAMTERKDKAFDKIRAAVKELNATDWKRDLTCGRINTLKLEKRGKEWWLIAERGRRTAVRMAAQEPVVSQKEREGIAQFDEYLARYAAMTDEERVEIDAEVEKRLVGKAWGRPGAPGYDLTRKATIVQVVEQHLMAKINQASSAFCAPSENRQLTLREGPCLAPYKGAADIRRETKALLRFPTLPLLPYRP